MVDVVSKEEFAKHQAEVAFAFGDMGERLMHLETSAGGDESAKKEGPMDIDWEAMCKRAWGTIDKQDELLKSVPRVIDGSEVKVGQHIAGMFPDGSGAMGRVTETEWDAPTPSATVEHSGKSDLVWLSEPTDYTIVLFKEAPQGYADDDHEDAEITQWHAPKPEKELPTEEGSRIMLTEFNGVPVSEWVELERRGIYWDAVDAGDELPDGTSFALSREITGWEMP